MPAFISLFVRSDVFRSSSSPSGSSALMLVIYSSDADFVRTVSTAPPLPFRHIKLMEVQSHHAGVAQYYIHSCSYRSHTLRARP